MRFAELDRRITIRRSDSARDVYGEPSQTMTDVATVWASVKFAGRPGESMQANQIFNDHECAFFIRHPRTAFEVKASDEIVFDAIDYEILGVEEIGRKDGLRIFAKKRGNGGA